jgi:two-component system sensor histidine kinase YesM
MANFFRYTLSGGSAIITLKEEITHTRNYLKLQSMRMGSDLKYDIAISGELQNVRIVKLVMQPLVENSIMHGFKNKKRPLEINISTRRHNEDVVIVIKDNGTGADSGAMNRLLGDSSYSANSNYFAVNNVHKRLQNTFGTKYGLRFFSEPGAGTSVHITIPMSSQGEPNKYD